jgi:large subunit ribosomal protein L16
MLLQPKKRKFKKEQKRAFKRKSLQTSQANHKLVFGCYGLKAVQPGFIKASQIEAVRKVIIRRIRKIGRIWIRIYPQKPITQKSAKTRMGKGKGSVQYWVCPVRAGQILIEISGSISEIGAKNILKISSQKLPIITKFLSYEKKNCAH